ncbi:nitroreductase family protein [Desulfosudis oleivorans]|uniref:Nitroreductase n=1 Tax=Desulfosudis oleivorans (strain DSM 6200 / JCM 39069 / Hxd3) TaxID=96561 RepID=A8ZZC5_DESOH|nr:nitroreductase family protein [Desulfosudis oleivorans]ABW67278.1 nitroreductase [Desulfosudis oleivorans Hxd3]
MFESLKQAYLPDMNFPVRTIDAEKCSKCGRCFETCPTYGYRWEKGQVPEPVGYGGFSQACINCGNCIAVCPTGAITMTGSFVIPSGRYKVLLEGKMAAPHPLGAEEQPYETIEPELTEVEKAIYTRRSNRLFKDKPVPRELLARILEAGRFAPSAGNCQPYRFIVITNQKIIKEFERRAMGSLRLLKNLYMAKDGKRSTIKKIVFSVISWFSINKMDPRPITAMEKADHTDGAIYFDAPAVILILKDKRGISNPDLDTGICAQNMVLAAHSLGLGTCYVSLPMEPLSMPLMAGFRKKLGIGKPYVAVTSIAVGYARGKIDGPVKRDTPRVDWKL